MTALKEMCHRSELQSALSSPEEAIERRAQLATHNLHARPDWAIHISDELDPRPFFIERGHQRVTHVCRTFPFARRRRRSLMPPGRMGSTDEAAAIERGVQATACAVQG
jgi:hypothetical protein